MLEYLQTNDEGEFISLALKSFYNERDINIGYMALYVHRENGIAEQY